MTVAKIPAALARYRKVAEAASDAETSFNRVVLEKRRMLEDQRRTAWRRFHLLDMIWRAVQPLPDLDDATDAAMEAVFKDIGWIGQTGTVDDLPEMDDPVLDQLEPLAEAMHALAHGQEPDRAPEAVLSGFETWYHEQRGMSFYELLAARSEHPPVPSGGQGAG